MHPLISIVVITYNHEKYIAQCIKSLLTQSLSNFELIIVDDGSTDNTRKIIETFYDPRIIYHYQENMGPSSATNTGISLATTEFISLLSGDDMAYEDRLTCQYNYFIKHPETTLLFGRCQVIDEKGQSITAHPLQNLFNKTIYTTRHRLFRHFFFEGNCLNAVTCMLRRSTFLEKTNGFQYASLQLQDFMMWFEWLKHSDIVLLNEKLAYYRVRSNQQNLSSSKNDNRTFFENSIILENILDDIDIEFFKKTFLQDIKQPDFFEKISFELEKAFLYLKHKHPEIQEIGMKKLFLLLQDAKTRMCFLEKYRLSFKNYFDLTGATNTGYYDDFENFYRDIKRQRPFLHYDIRKFLPMIICFHKTKNILKRWLKK